MSKTKGSPKAAQSASVAKMVDRIQKVEFPHSITTLRWALNLKKSEHPDFREALKILQERQILWWDRYSRMFYPGDGERSKRRRGVWK